MQQQLTMYSGSEDDEQGLVPEIAGQLVFDVQDEVLPVLDEGLEKAKEKENDKYSTMVKSAGNLLNRELQLAMRRRRLAPPEEPAS